jgi:hypothetical protein
LDEAGAGYCGGWTVVLWLRSSCNRQLSASSQARNWLGDRYSAELETDKLDTAKLLASELVNDAVLRRWGVHQGTTHVWFELERAGPRIGIESRPEPKE